MARKPREILEGATYHVTARANRGEFILEDDHFKELFVAVLQEAKGKFQFEIINLVVMGNHVHLMIKPEEDDSLSSIMRWVLSLFATRVENPLKAGIAKHLFDYPYNCLTMMQRMRYKQLFTPPDPILFERVFQILVNRHSLS